MNARARLWMRRAIVSVLGLVAVVAVAGFVLLHSLDRPWLKARVQRIAFTSGGVEIDYRALQLDLFSGIAVEDLVVRSPEAVRAFAPELVRVGHVEAHWTPGSLLGGQGPMLSRVALHDVTFALVMDENGKTSLDAIPSSGPPPSPPPPVPLSQRASKLLANAPVVGQLEVDPIDLVLVRTQHGVAVERITLDGVALALTADHAAKSGWHVDAHLGSETKPLTLALARTRTATNLDARAHATMWLAIDATGDAVKVALDLRVKDQTFATDISAAHGLHAEVGLRFDPSAGRTEVTIAHTEAGDGAATADAAIVVPDAGDIAVSHARGEVDVAALLRWLPADLVPVTAERAHVRYEIDALDLGKVVHLAADGKVAIDVDLAKVAVTGDASIQIASGSLSLKGHAAEANGVAATGALKLASVHLAHVGHGDDRIAVDDLAIDLDGTQHADGSLDGRARLMVARATDEGATPASVRDGEIELRVQGLHPTTDDPIATSGDIAIAIDAASIDAQPPKSHAHVDAFKMHLHTPLLGHAPYAATMAMSASRILFANEGRVLADAPIQLTLDARDVERDAADPMASRGVVHAKLGLGAIDASLDATKAPDAVDFTMSLAAKSLKSVRAFLSPDLAGKAPWDRMTLALHSTGHVEDLRHGDPSIRHKTDIDVANFAFDGIAARSLALAVQSEGTADVHKGDMDLHAQGLTVNGDAPSDDHVTLSAAVNRVHPALQFKLATEGRAAVNVSGALSFDAARKALPYTFDAHLAKLAPLAPFAAKVRLDTIDLSALDVTFAAHGSILGVVDAVHENGNVQFAPTPTRSIALDGETDLHVAHFRWTKGATSFAMPTLAWHGTTRTSEGKRTLDSHIDVDSFRLDVGQKHADIKGITDVASATIIGDVIEPELVATQKLVVRTVDQDIVPEYPLGDISLSVAAERGPERVVHISEMTLRNGAGGTALSVNGNVDLGVDRKSLSLATQLTQDLGHLSTMPELVKGLGKLTIEAQINSPDLQIYRVRAAVKGENVTLTLPRAGINVENANGDVPITVALQVSDTGKVALLGSETRSAYSMLRFADQHPLLTHSGFLSITSIKTPYVTIAPLVGNLEIEQNFISLRQFEMGVRGGRITGQCGVDWEGAKSTVELHVRASGVLSSHGEPFDGNIAVAISAADRTIEGRAEIVRIGERHLLDLLDLQDPRHVDPAMNRIRTALLVGYPDHMRLIFDHGFANAHLELGGLARIVSIGELRGIPMGPIIDKMLAPVLDGTTTTTPETTP